MKPVYSEFEFKNSKGNDLLPLKCYGCENIFHKKKSLILRVLNIQNYSERNKFNVGKYCSHKCQCHHMRGHLKKELLCLNCNKIFIKLENQIKRTKNHFCTRSCAATYNNQHKTKGTRISKLEKWLKEQLVINYPALDIHYNRKDAINSELDIYIPSLKLAFELNGIFHYEPIYGPEKLSQIQNNDDRKFQACLEKNIELVIIDVSTLSYFKPQKAIKYLNIITNIINNKNALVAQM